MAGNFEDFLKTKQRLLLKSEDKQKKYRAQYEQYIHENAPEYKIKVYKELEENAKKTAKYHQAEINIARPEILSDTKERLRIINTYPELISKNVSKDSPLFFHGVSNISYLEDILSSGHLGYLENEDSHSLTSPGTVDVTTADSVDTSICDFTGLNVSNQNKFLPAGCLIAIAPKNDEEKAYANQDTGTEHNITTVNFKENPQRIVAFISTNENKDRMLELANKYNIDKRKIHTFDSFIEYLSQINKEKSKIEQSIENNRIFEKTTTSDTKKQRVYIQTIINKQAKIITGNHHEKTY